MKELPRNTTWISLNDLPVGTTEHELQAFLYEAGIHLPMDNVSVKQHQTRAQGCVAMRNADVADLVERALVGMKLNGQEPTVVRKDR